MKVWAFYGIKENSFVGFTTDKGMKEFILERRPDSFHVMKADIPITERFKEDYEFRIYDLEANTDNTPYNVPMTRYENEIYYWYGYILIQDMRDRMQNFLEYLFLVKFDEEERNSVYFIIHDALDFINKGEYEYNAMTFYIGCHEVFNSKLLSERFFKYRRDEDETLENFQNYALCRG